jgi:hypothetical protein
MWPAVRFSGVKFGCTTYRRQTPQTRVPTLLAQSACPFTTIPHAGSATLYNRLGLHPLRGGTEYTQHTAAGASGEVIAQHAEEKQLLHHLAIRALIWGHCTTIISGTSWFHVLFTPVCEVDDRSPERDILRATRGGRGEEGRKRNCR